MKTIVSRVLLLAGLWTPLVQGAPVSVGPYVLDDSAFADTLTGFSGSLRSSNDSPTAITDAEVSTYVHSTTGASIDLAFDSAPIYNGDGNDLALFFIGNESTVDVSLNDSTASAQSYTSTFLYDGNGDQYAVEISGSYYALSAALIDASDFGMSLDDVINGISIDLGTYNYLSLAGGFHTEPATVIPLPAPLMLMVSGLALLGLAGRRKHR